MATRIYLPSTGAAPATPDWDAYWDDTTTASPARLLAVTSKASSAPATKAIADTDSANKQFACGMWVSDPLDAQTITAQTVGISVKCSETNAANNMFLCWSVRVFNHDCTVVRGELVSFRTDGTEVPLTASEASRYDELTCVEVAAEAGDRLVIEVGLGGNPIGGAYHDSQLVIGDNAGSDLDAADGDSAGDPWVNFAETISFGAGSPSASPSATASASPSATESPSPSASESPSPSSTPSPSPSGSPSASESASPSEALTFDDVRDDIINGLVSDGSEANGWDADVIDALIAAPTSVVRTSDTVVTITLPAVAGYAITATEAVTATVPAVAVDLYTAIVATPAFNITNVGSPSGSPSGSASASPSATVSPSPSGSPSGTPSSTPSSTLSSSPSSSISASPSEELTFEAVRQDIIDGLTDLTQSPATGWNALVRDAIPVANVVRTSATVVTVTLPAAPLFNISEGETITPTVPNVAVELYAAIVGSTFTVDVAGSPSQTPSPSPSGSPSATESPSPSATPSASPSWSDWSDTGEFVTSRSGSPSGSPSPSPSGSPSASESASPSAGSSASASPSATPSPSPSGSPSASASASPSSTPSATASQSPSASESASPSEGSTPSGSPSATPSASPSEEIPEYIAATNTLWQMTALTGGAAGALDSLDGGSLTHGDRAWCVVSGAFWIYELDSGSGQTDNGTTIIAPDTNAGNKRWIRCTRGA